MSLRIVAVSYDGLDPEALAVLWAGMLGREIVGEFTCDGTREVGLFWRDALEVTAR